MKLRNPKEIEMPRSANNYDAEENSNQGALECHDEHRTQQQFAEESDINFIADRFGLTDNPIPEGFIVQEGGPVPQFMNYEGIFNFQTAQNQVTAARQAFMALPAKVRTRFSNDPQEYLDFFNDPNNMEEAIRLGIATRRQDAPQSPQGDAGAKGLGESPTPEPDAPAKPTKASTKKNTDT